MLGLAGGVSAAGKKPARQEPFALIAGTVFRDTGFALPGAEVTVKTEPGAQNNVKFKPLKLETNHRGEFVTRVLALPKRYTVTVKARGFRPQSKTVVISGDERVDVFFHLEAEPKN